MQSVTSSSTFWHTNISFIHSYDVYTKGVCECGVGNYSKGFTNKVRKRLKNLLKLEFEASLRKYLEIYHLVKNKISTIIMTRQSYLNAYISAAI